MIIKHNNDSIVIKREENETIPADFWGFIADIYNDSDIDAGYLSELEYAGNDCAGYYIAGFNDCKPFAVFVDNFDHDNMLNDGITVLPYYKGWTDDEITNLIMYGTENPDCVLHMDENEEFDIYFSYSDIDTTTFNVWSILFCDENENVEYSIDFDSKENFKWYIDLCNIDVLNYETFDNCQRDAFVINESDGYKYESDAITVNVCEHCAYTNAR